MSTQIQTDATHYTIEWDDEIEAVVHTWDKFAAGEQFREGCEALLECVRSNGAARVIVDTSNVQAHEQEDKQWLETEWTPRAVEAGVERMATVHKDSAIARMDVGSIGEQDTDAPMDVLLTSDMAEAKDWIAGA